MNPTHSSPENPYQPPASDPLPPDSEHWRRLRRQFRATILAEQRRAIGWGLLAVVFLFGALHIWPEKDLPLLQQLQDHATWPALTMLVFTLLSSGLACHHILAASGVRRRVNQLEREHPESSPDFFSAP